MLRDQQRPPAAQDPLWRLLLEELALLAKRVGRWKVTAVSAVVGLAVLVVEVLLSDSTPGPALSAPTRWVVATVASAVALVVWAVGHAVRRERREVR